jgi:molybdate transport system substrate-binding protein
MPWLAPVLLAAMFAASPTPAATPLTVSAAVSLTDSLEAIAGAYTATGGGRVRFNFAGSNVLARQLVNGAPADVFISADEAQMDVAVQGGAVDAGSRVPLLANRLAVIVGTDLARHHAIRTIRDLLAPDVRRIAIGDPAAVPAGVYARAYFHAAGVWDAIDQKIVPVANVRAALAVVGNGSADAAIVYETDAALSSNAVTAFVISGPGAPRIVYPAAIASHSKRKDEAQRFLAFLRGSSASAIFRTYGFTPLSEGR